MANFMYDVGLVRTEMATKEAKKTQSDTSPDLNMTDFLQLMVVQLQSQTIDNTADTSDMLNQLVQMQMVTALANVTDASVMSYAGSLVGKEVTVLTYDGNKAVEKVITVTGTATSNGEQVIFAGDEAYKLSDIMAIGRLPKPEESEKPGDGDGDTDGDKPVDGDKPTDGDKPVDGDKPTDGDKPPVDGDKPVEGTDETGNSGTDTEEKPDETEPTPEAVG
ncbi:hypothetical protein D1159_16030 [Pseudoflavonifractor sp. 524-17]|uniref:flagellar hook capping FlgD N-terminal domain-containing protein n=1 Tax=Pseudoflavonifractor sp. 524-17 TaxID=2304577 RepID=UPI00137A1D12|nr:flagellar hook capping FlgD N-terminal domain-containing protein [Pseudoflavonifractor sp. 524-17]NCE66045.1 hypothetical protein [Pseudoflavonifractor sp. 524-17]